MINKNVINACDNDNNVKKKLYRNIKKKNKIYDQCNLKKVEKLFMMNIKYFSLLGSHRNGRTKFNLII